jgi:hypothetical protein
MDDVSTADAQTVHSGEVMLTRLLALALPNDEKRSRAIREALRISKRSELPNDATELLQFVRAHLAPQLGRDVAPNLILALIDDLTLELQGVSSARGPIGVRKTSPDLASSALLAMRGSPPSLDELVSTPFPKLKQSVANLVRTASGQLRAVRRVATDPGSVRILLVEADPIARATVARALVNAQFDVTIFDTPFEAARLTGIAHSLALVLDIAIEGAESALRVLAKSFPTLVVVVWTDVPTPIVDVALDEIGVADYRLLPRSAGAGEVAECVRRLLVAPSSPDSTK